jgi:hypothetical protein
MKSLGYELSKIFNSPCGEKINNKWFCKICDSEIEETQSSIFHKGKGYHFVKEIIPKNESEDNWEFILKNITPYLKHNESLRDKMSPVSEEDIRKRMGDEKYHIYKTVGI